MSCGFPEIKVALPKPKLPSLKPLAIAVSLDAELRAELGLPAPTTPKLPKPKLPTPKPPKVPIALDIELRAELGLPAPTTPKLPKPKLPMPKPPKLPAMSTPVCPFEEAA